MDRARLGAAMSLTMISPELSSILTGPRHCSAPDWVKELQAKAWDEFEAEPFPARTNELWRFSSLKNLALDGYVPAPEYSGDPSIVTSLREFPKPAGRIIFANEAPVMVELLDPALERAGVIFTTLARALKQHPQLLREHFVAQPARLGS